jgi:hypothetical protein
MEIQEKNLLKKLYELKQKVRPELDLHDIVENYLYNTDIIRSEQLHYVGMISLKYLIGKENQRYEELMQQRFDRTLALSLDFILFNEKYGGN